MYDYESNKRNKLSIDYITSKIVHHTNTLAKPIIYTSLVTNDSRRIL